MTNKTALSAGDLTDRLQFMKWSGGDQAALRAISAQVQRHLPAAMAAFYGQVRSTPATRELFVDTRQMDKGEARQVSHWEQLIKASFEDAYANDTRNLAEASARMGFEPKWCIGGYAVILDLLIREILAEKGSLFGGRKGSQTDGVVALVKAAMFDLELILSVYFEASEAERRRTEEARAAAAQAQTLVMEKIAAALGRLADGDMTSRISDAFPAEYGRLRDDFNAVVDTLHDAMSSIGASAESIRNGAGEISRAADDLSRRTEQQAASLEETAAALDEITATVKTTAEGAKEANRVVAEARQDAEKGGQVVGQAVAAMSQIEQSSKQIGQIIGVIDEIAFQTNLLALNAGVEAARAGDAGKGFAVVASEVRALAQRSADAAKEIKTLISASSDQVSSGVQLVGQTGEALGRIVTQVAAISGLVSDISASAQEQSTGLGEVNSAVNQMDHVTQQNAAMVEQSTAASHAVAGEAEDLMRLMERFEVGVSRKPAAAAPKARPAAAPRTATAMKTTGGRGASAAHKPAASEDWEEF